MKLIFVALLFLGILGLSLATTEQLVRWCVQSENEQEKCNKLKEVLTGTTGPSLSCIKKISYKDCLRAIWNNEADAICVDGGLIYEASVAPFDLKPIIAEDYGSEEEHQIYSFAVAIVKKGTDFQFRDLKGKKSCHNGLAMSAGWIIPIGKLVELGMLNWNSIDDTVEKAVAEFFSDSCVPCSFWTNPQLCRLCIGAGPDACTCSNREPYFGSSGAFRCLKDGVGDVSFMEHTTLLEILPTEAERDKFELLCVDNTRRSVNEYRKCHLGRVPANAVVARRVNSKEDLIWNLLSEAQERFGKGKSETFQLFGSHLGKDLLFKDSTNRFLRLPPRMDHEQYLGYDHMKAVKTLTMPETFPLIPERVRWCAVSQEEEFKCHQWSLVSGLAIEYVVAETTEECITKIMKGEADAMSLDGGFIYIAGKCGLEVVLAENYKTKDSNYGRGPLCPSKPIEGYYAVAVVRKSDADLKWGSLQGKKACHTAINRAAGWTIPMGLIHNQTNSCDIDKYFSESCAPGADVNSSLCTLCAGSPGTGGLNKCAANIKEKYYGFTGAFRCLAENKGDVAFVKHTTVLDNTDGKNQESWAQKLKSGDFELLCLDGKRKPVTEAKNCHLAQAPNHAVVSRPDKATFVRQVLLNQQDLFGTNGSEWQMFQMFQSRNKDLLFTDNTECLSEVPGKRTYEKYLGPEYIKVIESLRKCTDTSDLLPICEFINPQKLGELEQSSRGT
ncbi:inhibitor of carbonic anhydrase-like isoform X1 [Macrotis lagotis]|uniref:inhibitor of carbonic anhydrase-like isoform X1 n=1 Tax=Macrotis lagotis TaxID=92651 RepID=UPI003D68AC50